ncbi:MAG TPA: hypothetical protein VF613_11240 [Longimicrobium sp.]|jgi:hypothetical protein
MDRRARLFVALAVLAGCARTSLPDAPSGEPYVRGPVESFTHHATASRLLVRPGPGSPDACGIAATVDARTRYLQRGPSGEPRAIPRSSVGVGDTVEVYVTGAIAESCPAQAYAAVVVLVARP